MKAFICIFFLFLRFKSNSQSDLDKLEKAYQNYSFQELNVIFENWANKTRKLSFEELNSINDTIKNAYIVFQTVYNPNKLNNLGKFEHGDSIYRNIKYALVQNSISIYTNEKIYYNDSEVDSFIIKSINKLKIDSVKKKFYQTKVNGKFIPFILDNFKPEDIFDGEEKNTFKLKELDTFYPNIEYSGLKQICLTRKIKDTLTFFLKDSHTNFGSKGIMSPAKEQGESKKRKEFLENFIKIYYGHWGGYWQLNTYPQISKIVFDKNFEYARIYYKMVNEGSEATLKKENNTWKIVKAKKLGLNNKEFFGEFVIVIQSK